MGFRVAGAGEGYSASAPAFPDTMTPHELPSPCHGSPTPDARRSAADQDASDPGGPDLSGCRADPGELCEHDARLLWRSRAFLTAADPMFVEDLEGHVLDMNDRAEQVFGWPRDEMLGSSIRALFGDAPWAMHLTALRSCCDDGSIVDLETELRCRSGAAVPVEFGMTAVRDVHGSATAIVLVTKDLRERRRLDRLRAAAVVARFRAEEQERQRLAGEIHDSLAQLVALARIHVSALRDGDDSVAPGTRLDRLDELLADIERRTRSVMFRLTPGDIGTQGLAHPLREMCSDIASRYRMEVELVDRSEGRAARPVDSDIAVALFRAVRELLINAARHAEVDRAEVHLAMPPDRDLLIADVVDAGRGFDWTPGRAHGFGLRRVVEKVDAIGGSIEIDTAPGRGTRVRITMPLEVGFDPHEVLKEH